jgi:hypothetical protein
VANNLAKVSMNDIYSHKMNQMAARLGTLQSRQAADAFTAQKALESNQLLLDASQNRAMETANSAQGPLAINTQNPSMGAMASNIPTSEQGNADNDHILNAQAQRRYDQLKYQHNKTPEQIHLIQDQYQRAIQADKSIDQIKTLWPELRAKANFSGWAAEHIDPHATAAVTGPVAGGVAALTGAGLPLAGGIGALGAGAGEAGARLAKAGLTGISGQEGIQYNTAVDSLITQVGNALGTGITPTEKAEIAKDFIPTWRDDEETSNNKLDKLIKKIKAVAQTGALKDSKMTND